MTAVAAILLLALVYGMWRRRKASPPAEGGGVPAPSRIRRGGW